MLEWLRDIRQIWKATREREKERVRIKRQKDELDFLPAALEVLETPPSPAGRITTYCIISLFAIAVSWAWFGKIDIEAVAQGRIIPTGQVKAIQSLEIGKVEEILVREGEYVEEGQHLIRLDPTESAVDQQQVAHDLLDSQLNTYRLELILENARQTKANYGKLVIPYVSRLKKDAINLSSAPSESQLALQHSLLNRDLEVWKAMRDIHKAESNKLESTIRATRAEKQRLETLRPLHNKQERVMKKLMTDGMASETEWMTSQEKLIETEQGLVVQHNRLLESEASLQALKSSAWREQQQFRSERLQQLHEYRLRQQSNALILKKAKERYQNRYLSAPVAGRVHQLQVHSIGGVVQPAELLMTIIPDNVPLEVEAMVLNKDVGFIQPGQEVQIKIESYSYTRYGLVEGVVRQISSNAIDQEGAGLVYPMRVTLKNSKILVNDHWRELQPGMSATAEVKIGYRRLMDFFLSNFIRYQDESMKER